MTERLLSPDETLLDAVNVIESSRKRIAVVVGSDGLILGTLTDGDVRRSLLQGGGLTTSVRDAMNANPITAVIGTSSWHLLDLMRRGDIAAVPLVDHKGKFKKIVHRSDLAGKIEVKGETLFDFAVIMAGGEGIRLRPITQNIPKPMVDIGGVPLLERQIKRLVEVGVKRIYLSISYLGHLIKDHFGSGDKLGVEIRYLLENKKMGTGGALSLLPEKPTAPILVMNGDILTTSDFKSLLEFHTKNCADLTVATVEHLVSIPYGVINNEGPFVRSVVEKPSQRFRCNAGIYVLAPRTIELVPPPVAFNMTDLIERCIKTKRRVVAFPVHEYWSDIGTRNDLDKARVFYSEKL